MVEPGTRRGLVVAADPGGHLPNYEKLRAAGTTAYLINREWNAPYDDGRNRVTDIGEFARAVLGSAGPSVR